MAFMVIVKKSDVMQDEKLTTIWCCQLDGIWQTMKGRNKQNFVDIKY